MLHSLVTLGLVLARLQIIYGQITTCSDIEGCMKYYESTDCNAYGERHVCLSWMHSPTCTALDPSVPSVLQICRMHDFSSTTYVFEREMICDIVKGDSIYGFGILSTHHNGNTGSGPITINGYTNNGGMATCDGFTNVCQAEGDNDFKLSFHITPCPGTPPCPDCTCNQWSNWSGCSATCGSTAMRTQTRACYNCDSPFPPISQTGSCPGVPSQCPTNPPTSPEDCRRNARQGVCRNAVRECIQLECL